MGIDEITNVLKFAEERWERRSTPLILVLLVLLISFPIAASVKLSEIGFVWWLIISAICLTTVLLWWSSTRLPKVPKGKVGFLVAIRHEDPSKQTTFGNDFIRVLNELIQGGNLAHQIRLVELNRFHSSKITDVESARAYLHRTKSHFLLYGRVRERTLDGKANHFLNLQGIVTHSPIPIPVSQSFSAEMSSLLPRKLQIAKEGDVFSFEFTARLTDVVSRYIIGMASLLSADSRYAIELFEDVRNRLTRFNERIPPISILKVRIPTRLEEAYQIEMNKLYLTWMSNRDKQLIQQLSTLVDRVLALRPNNHHAHIFAAICAFLLQRDTKKAMKEIKQCRTAKDRTWYYSKAFLLAYEGKMKQAIAAYESVFARPSDDPSVPLQTEQFIIDVLGEEPERIQFHFCLGLINYYGKKDLAAARRDFNNFLSTCPKDKFVDEVAKATEYVRQIDSKLKSCKEGDYSDMKMDSFSIVSELEIA